MTARFLWKHRGSLRRIDKQARATVDPVERLRYVRDQMDLWKLPKAFRRRPARTIAAVIAAAAGAALLLWRIH